MFAKSTVYHVSRKRPRRSDMSLALNNIAAIAIVFIGVGTHQLLSLDVSSRRRPLHDCTKYHPRDFSLKHKYGAMKEARGRNSNTHSGERNKRD